jgi:F-type H+-transporting ATPase subunit delta
VPWLCIFACRSPENRSGSAPSPDARGAAGVSERRIVATTDQTVSGVPGRYASALFELAGEEKATELVGHELANVQSAIDQSADLSRLVRSPVFSADDQVAALAAVAGQIGVTGTTLNFLKLAAKNRRLSALPDMIKAYATLLSQSKGEIAGEVTSAAPLSAQQLSDLKAALKTALGRDVALSTRVDDSILGGLIVKVGSRMMDNSLKTKLQSLKIAMKGTA